MSAKREIISGTLKCKECGIYKPLSDFYVVRGRIHTYCKKCHCKRQYHSYKKHSEKRIKKNREYIYKSKYNLSIEDYEKILIFQEFRCALCKVHQSKTDRLFSVDHNHETGEVRGLLCNNCNRAIGLLKDNSEILMRASEYVRNRDVRRKII